MIGQNLADLTHPEFSTNIADSLKPSLIVSTSIVDECVVSQHRQFFVKLKPSVSYSTSPSHSVRCVLCALSLSLFSSLLSLPLSFYVFCMYIQCTVKNFHGRKISPTPATFVLQKHFAEFIFADTVKGAIFSVQSLTQEKKIFNFANESR